MNQRKSSSGDRDVGSLRDAEFEDYVRRRRSELLRSATLLTSGDAHLAEDLVQTTLTRLYLKWSRARSTNLDAYARRVLVNNLIDHHRRPFMRRERHVAEVPDVAAVPGSGGQRTGFVDEVVDHQLLAALATLPPRMRAVVVLRYVEGLDVAEAAHALGCSSGTVKSQASRGVEKLRDLLRPAASGSATASTSKSQDRMKETVR
ncbi:RNA polymerase sigma factor [Rhodococcus maanshanensis]|uniref:RNA polymerase sigma factor n=1 Tax=Rhodococcus maanshanensis TaxID=183556 RepID=UPI0009F88F40|nr:SigE family RNA polymerase sigma factor [Rhodococcus maanshanensis]